MTPRWQWVALGAVVLTTATGCASARDDGDRRPAAGVVAADPHRVAVRTAEAIIASAPMVPGAVVRGRAPLAALDQPSTVLGAQYVQRTRFWTTRGTVAATVSHLDSHPPNGMRPSGSGSAAGPGVPTTQMLDFQADAFRTLQYTVVADRAGSAVRADAQVLWAPARSPADRVPASVSSVEVTVARLNPQLHRGAPTVRRTLTGARARALADFVNRLPRAVPTFYASCPADFGGEQRYDRLVFHSDGPTATVTVNLAGCSSATFQIGNRKSIQLSRTYVGDVEELDRSILHALALPINYGR